MKSESSSSALEQIQKLSDVRLTLRVELDQTILTFEQLMALEVGGLLQLNRPTGENIDVYVEEALLGWGEVLLMDGMMTVRLADLRNARLPGLHADEEIDFRPQEA